MGKRGKRLKKLQNDRVLNAAALAEAEKHRFDGADFAGSDDNDDNDDPAVDTSCALENAITVIARLTSVHAGTVYFLESPHTRSLRLALRPSLLATVEIQEGGGAFASQTTASGSVPPGRPQVTKKKKRQRSTESRPVASPSFSSFRDAGSTSNGYGSFASPSRFEPPSAASLARATAAIHATLGCAANLVGMDDNANSTYATYSHPTLRPLRKACAPLLEALRLEYRGGTPAMVGPAIRDMRVGDCLAALEAMRVARQRPRLGSLQRWVRECDAWQGDEERRRGALRMLDAVLRLNSSFSSSSSSSSSGVVLSDGSVDSTPLDSAPHDSGRIADAGSAIVGPPSLCPPVTEADLTAAARRLDAAGFSHRVVHTVSASQRTPPNRSDLNIYVATSSVPFADGKAVCAMPNASSRAVLTNDAVACAVLRLRTGDKTQQVDGRELDDHTVRTDLPDVPGAFVISNICDASELAAIRVASDRMGFVVDEPVTRSDGASDEESQQLNQCSGDTEDRRALNVVWLACPRLNGELFRRCKKHLPKEVAGGRLASLNARWRLYAYSAGDIYRPHIDGAWPPSGFNADSGEYEYDTHGGRQTSRFTMVLYLNDGFSGGTTTFYTPARHSSATGGMEGGTESHDSSTGAQKEEIKERVLGTLEARGVVPVAGSALFFPHGDACEALVHEGARVTAGKKYILRTDVIYWRS